MHDQTRLVMHIAVGSVGTLAAFALAFWVGAHYGIDGGPHSFYCASASSTAPIFPWPRPLSGLWLAHRLLPVGFLAGLLLRLWHFLGEGPSLPWENPYKLDWRVLPWALGGLALGATVGWRLLVALAWAC